MIMESTAPRHSAIATLANELLLAVFSELDRRDIIAAAGASRRLRSVASGHENYFFVSRLSAPSNSHLPFDVVAQEYCATLRERLDADVPVDIHVDMVKDYNSSRGLTSEHRIDAVGLVCRGLECGAVIGLDLQLRSAQFSEVVNLLQTPAPALKRFSFAVHSIGNAYGNTVEFPEAAFAGNAPLLRTVSFLGVKLPERPLEAFSHVTRLTLHILHITVLHCAVEHRFPRLHSLALMRLPSESKLLDDPNHVSINTNVTFPSTLRHLKTRLSFLAVRPGPQTRRIPQLIRRLASNISTLTIELDSDIHPLRSSMEAFVATFSPADGLSCVACRSTGDNLTVSISPSTCAPRVTLRITDASQISSDHVEVLLAAVLQPLIGRISQVTVPYFAVNQLAAHAGADFAQSGCPLRTVCVDLAWVSSQWRWSPGMPGDANRYNLRLLTAAAKLDYISGELVDSHSAHVESARTTLMFFHIESRVY